MSNPVPRNTKTRSSTACLSCRGRKVRCDVSHHGQPCTNCSLDKQNCVVKRRSAKYNVSKNHITGKQKTAMATLLPNQGQLVADSSIHTEACSSTGYDTDDTWGCLPDTQDLMELDKSLENTSGLIDLTKRPWEQSGGTSKDSDREGKWDEPDVVNENFKSYSSENRHNEAFVESKHVIYCYYPFLKLDNIFRMCSRDVSFLEQKGCFHVPNPPLLDEFVQEYFLHVNPHLPILDEGKFWDIYKHEDPLPPYSPPIPLFLLQAMLFISCSYLSPKTLNDLGFKNARSARGAYYGRAKALFDFDEDKDSIIIAQGALLLSYHSPSRNMKANTFWLSIAIQSAKDVGAHQYYSSSRFCPEQRSIRKRLWWCCILRDRILPLGVRRPLLIGLNDFDFNRTPLSEIDFEDEIHKSRVYDAAIKCSLVRLIAALCELAVVLTQVIMVVYPSNEYVPSDSSTESEMEASLVKIEGCHRSLDCWYENISKQFPAGLVDAHESLILYTRLIYIYYHSAKLALSHHVLLMLATQPRLKASLWDQKFESKSQLEKASGSITEHMKIINQLKLSRYLPISVVAYTTLPLVLHVLDVKLSTTATQVATKQGRLSIYTEAMEEFKTQYDGADHVCDLISEIIHHLDLKNLTEQSCMKKNGTNYYSPVRDWGDVFLRQPKFYLRLSLTIDFSLSKGRFPTDNDFPVSIQAIDGSRDQFPMFCIVLEDTYSRSETDDCRNHGNNQRQESDSLGSQMDYSDIVDSLATISDNLNANTSIPFQDTYTSFGFGDLTQFNMEASEQELFGLDSPLTSPTKHFMEATYPA